MQDSPQQKTSVVVVGGGIGGANIARTLSIVLDPAWHNLTLITPRENYVYLPASLRALVDPNFPLSSVFMPYTNIFGPFPGKIIRGTVTCVEENKHAVLSTLDDPIQPCSGEVICEIPSQTPDDEPSRERIHYDILVVATGSQWEGFTAFPNETEKCKAHVEIWREKFKNASDIVIAGGGAVGLETAGEIKDIYPDAKVTIVHADRLPLNEVYPDRFRTLVEHRFRARGVDFIFNDAITGNPVISKSSPKLTTRNGLKIQCDLFVPARGGRPSTLHLSFLTPTPLTARGFVRVLPTLQLPHHPNIFAVGDIVDWPEIRQLVKIQYGHADVVVTNIVRMLQGKSVRRKYKGVGEFIMITNGKKLGSTFMGWLGGWVLGDWFTSMLKSRELGVNKARRRLDLEPVGES